MNQRILSVCIVGLLLAGCQRTGQQGPGLNADGPSGSMTWHEQPADKAAAIPGIDHGGAQYVGKTFVLWAADTRGGGSSDSSSATGIKSSGYVSFSSGHRTSFEFSTTDGKTGPVKIDGVSYQLADGPLFLLARDGEKLRVKQLKKDLSTLELNAKGFQKFGRADPEIMEFFTSKKPNE